MSKIKVGSRQLDHYVSTPEQLIANIQQNVEALKKEGATTIQVDYDTRDYNDNYHLYLDGYREMTAEEIQAGEKKKEEQKQQQIEYLKRQLAALGGDKK